MWREAENVVARTTKECERLELKIEHMGPVLTSADQERIEHERSKMAARVETARRMAQQAQR